MAHTWVGRGDLVQIAVWPESRQILRDLAKDRKRLMSQQFAWMCAQFSDAGDVANLSVPLRVVEKLQRLANVFKRSPIDQLEWMLNRELTKREDLLRALEEMGEGAEQPKKPRLIIGGIEERDRRIPMGA